MTKLNEIMNILLPLIPVASQDEIRSDLSLVERGVMDMAIETKTDFTFTEITSQVLDEVTGEIKDVIEKAIVEDLAFSKKWISAHYAYRAYLLRKRDTYIDDAINFKTLTFEIKSLEKRPENLNDAIYQLERYIGSNIDELIGRRSIKGKAVQFGGANNG